jgi:hypothetical protein
LPATSEQKLALSKRSENFGSANFDRGLNAQTCCSSGILTVRVHS